MPVGRHKRDQLAVGGVVARRTDHSRLAVVVEVPANRGSKQCEVRIMTADGQTRSTPAPYGYLPRWGEYLRRPAALNVAEPLLQQLRELIAAERRASHGLDRPTLTRYEAAELGRMRVQSVDHHRLAGAFVWRKNGREVLIDRESFTAWLTSRGLSSGDEVADVAEA